MINAFLSPSLRDLWRDLSHRVHHAIWRRYCLSARVAYMSVLRCGARPECRHEHLKTGLLEGREFHFGCGDDILCADCEQVWAATQEMDYFVRVGDLPTSGFPQARHH